MLLFEILTWVAFGLFLGLFEIYLAKDPGRTPWILVGSALAALLGGLLGHLLVSQSVVVRDYNYVALLLSGCGAIAFLAIDWAARHRPSMKGR
jgi:hypothetical protein